jgi:O-antigen/teichoic acid export membrane protein
MSLFSRSFWKDLLLTYSAETIVMGCAFLAPAILGRMVRLEDLGIYLLLRRVVSSLMAPLSLGMAVALARFLPMRRSNAGIQVRWSMLGIGLATGFTGLVGLVILELQRPVAKLLLGNPQLAPFVLPLTLLVLGNVLHAVLYGHYRGTMNMRMANAAQAINLGIVPVVAVFRLRSMGLAGVLNLTGLLMLGVSGLFLLPVLRSWVQTRSQVPMKWLGEAGRSLLGYGLGRVPGFVFAGLLFTVGPIWLAHRATMADVAIFALGLTFMRMGGAFFGPVGVLVLPRLARVLGQEQEGKVKRDLQLLLRTAMLFALFTCMQAATLHSTMLKIWLGSAPAYSRELFVPLVLVLPLYLAYEVLRNPIDAISIVPYNSISLGAALLALALGVIGRSMEWLVVSQCGSFLLLGVISITVLGRLYNFPVFELRSWFWPSLVSIGSVPLTWYLERHLQGKIVLLGIYEIVLFGFFLVSLTLTQRTLRSDREVADYPTTDATASFS